MLNATPSARNAPATPRGRTLFAYSFRPFFLLAGLQATVALPVWILLYGGGITLPTSLPPSVWHAHEMLYGYATAVLAGFFLTAEPNWTGAPPLRGWPLAGLVLLWLTGRVFVWLSAFFPERFVAIVDLAFVPTLAAVVGTRIVASGATRQVVFILLLTLLFCGNLLIQLDSLGTNWGIPSRQGIYMAVDTFALVITVMGGRIVPSFTENALRGAGREPKIKSHPVVEQSAIWLTGLVIPLELALGDDPIVGAVFLAAAAAQFVRLAGWRSLSTLDEPILWVLHLGYLWVPLGLMLRGLEMAFGAVPASAGLHAITVGAIGTMTLAVMSRAALGHTGRPLKAAPLTVIVYGLITLAAVIRVLGAAIAPETIYRMTLDISGAAWTLAFGLFLVVYGPILLRPRVDGKPG